MKPPRAWLPWLALLGLVVSGAQAQGQHSRGGAPGDFDFYVLALSWSPGFCELEDGGRGRSREQCAPGANLGFVVHGLWPQNERGFPTDCGPAGRSPSRMAMSEAEGLFPSEGLARHQWRKHGTCTGSSPSDYFADVRRAREKIVIPPPLRDSGREQLWTPIDLERAFVAANPGLRTDMMSVACRRGVLQEVRICLTRDLRSFRTCQEVDRSGCRAPDFRVNSPAERIAAPADIGGAQSRLRPLDELPSRLSRRQLRRHPQACHADARPHASQCQG